MRERGNCPIYSLNSITYKIVIHKYAYFSYILTYFIILLIKLHMQYDSQLLTQRNQVHTDSITNQYQQPLIDHRSCNLNNNNQEFIYDHQPSHPSCNNDQDPIDQRFQIIESIGEGTYGCVFKAYDLQLKKVSQSQNIMNKQ